MTINHHLDEATVLRYASGDLNEAFAVVAAAHLAMCEECLGGVRDAEQIGGDLLCSNGEAGLDDGAFAALMRRIEKEGDASRAARLQHLRLPQDAGGSLPAPLQRLVAGPLEAAAWKKIAPGVWRHRLPVSSREGGSLFLLKIAPGKTVPEHGHGGGEMTLVLSGSYRDELGRFAAGDIADLDEHVEHQPRVDSDEPCICVVATEAPTRFKGALSRLLQPLFGI